MKLHDWGEPEPNPHAPNFEVRYTCKVCGMYLFAYKETIEEIREKENTLHETATCDGFLYETARQVMES
jgi:hypothetical protein